jgi:hypothetical protein
MPTDPATTELLARLDELDTRLFDAVEAQLTPSDRRALLGLHAAAADVHGSFAYLEVGSYRGGSLQVLMRDPRCVSVMSIDPRTSETPDSARGTYTYEDNTTAHMRELLTTLDGADMNKLHTFDRSTDAMDPAELPCRPEYCFVDGEHTHDAVVRDGRFCVEALGRRGVVAFHDAQLVKDGIRRFLKEHWRDVSHAMALPGEVFAVEFGDTGLLRSAVIEGVIDSRWHSTAWRLASRSSRSVAPLVATWQAMPVVDKLIFDAKQRMSALRGG